MKKTWFLVLAAVVTIVGFALLGYSEKSPGVQMCEKSVAEISEKRDCQDEYSKKSKTEQEMMDKMGKAVMDKCGSKKGKEFAECFNAAAIKGMSK